MSFPFESPARPLVPVIAALLVAVQGSACAHTRATEAHAIGATDPADPAFLGCQGA